MGVPTIYYLLINYYKDSLCKKYSIKDIKKKLSRLRLMVCGSASLPEKVMKEWKDISGHTLLERYGMTEIGMAIGNPYRGERRCVLSKT